MDLLQQWRFLIAVHSVQFNWNVFQWIIKNVRSCIQWDLLFLYKWLDNKLSANWKLNWRKKGSKQPLFLDCHQLFLSVFWGIVFLSLTSTLHKKKVFCIVKYCILKKNYRNWLKMKIASDFCCRNKLVSNRK